MNNYYSNINQTIEINPKSFFRTTLMQKMEKQKLLFIERGPKMSEPWSLNIPKRFKRYAVNADLHRSKIISTNFDKKNIRIKRNFLAADYPRKFLQCNFENDKVQSVEDDRIPHYCLRIAT